MSTNLGKWRELNSQLIKRRLKPSVKPFDNTPNAGKKGYKAGCQAASEADIDITQDPSSQLFVKS